MSARDAATGDPPALLQVEGLVKHFPLKRRGADGARELVRAVDGLDFTVRQGETLGIVGESGCGKSTTSRLIMALTAPSAGSIRFDGQLVGSRTLPLKAYRRQVQMVFQDSYSSLNPRLSIEELIAFAPRVHGVPQREALARAHELLQAVGLEPGQYARRFPHQLSGGQRQRVNIARALALRPRLLILDEPVSALDKSVEAQVLNLLVELKQRFDLSYLFISHDLNVVRYMADRVLVMYLGKLAEIGGVQDIYAQPAHPYTAALLQSRLTMEPARRRQQAPLQGDPPNPIDPPSGCRFRTRCACAEPVCTRQVPPQAAVAPDHAAACLMALPGSGHSRAAAPMAVAA
ncbi:ABC transporter ATP-binding protein [Pseudorhodoferax sp.]|uniref:ABC transporter ATP-binding protein n=1 Tax=Pseudorhodoferax sp. TaxID=1993553 RepID=UPI002DD644F2|nr:ABC transporter ATP-binding protein [Pseudorhodoferax sp.]